MDLSGPDTPIQSSVFERPYVVSWNLTYRCNLACEHCYLDAGASKARREDTPAFADRSELSTSECFTVIDQLASFAPEAILILTGGEPLLRRDIVEIVRYANSKNLWVVVGTNGVLITEQLVTVLKTEGVRGMALSLDALNCESHDRFRVVKGAFENTVQGAKILNTLDLPFIIQTTVAKHNLDELSAIADFAFNELGAKVWNLYFLVPSGRGKFISDITDQQYDSVLESLFHIQKQYFGRMKVNAKCAPHYVRSLFERDQNSPFLKSFAGGAGGCPAGTQYLGIRPNGDVTPCPYLPVFGGNIKETPIAEIWNGSELFQKIRARSNLGGRCGSCEFNPHCGGCRARAYGATNDFLNEDPLCSYTPGKYDSSQIQIGKWSYGEKEERTLEWEEEARERIKKVPAFLRGMVIKAIEARCHKQNIHKVSVAELERIKAEMSVPPIFGRDKGNN